MWFASVVRRWWGWAGERLGGRLLLLLLFTWPGISKKENRAQGRARVASSAGWFSVPVWDVGPLLLRLRRVQPRCGGCAGRLGGYTVVAKQEPRHGGGVVNRARGQIGFSEAAAAAVRLVGWVGFGGGWAGGSNFSQTKRHRGAKCPIIVIIASMRSACILWYEAIVVSIHYCSTTVRNMRFMAARHLILREKKRKSGKEKEKPIRRTFCLHLCYRALTIKCKLSCVRVSTVQYANSTALTAHSQHCRVKTKAWNKTTCCFARPSSVSPQSVSPLSLSLASVSTSGV